MGRPVVSIADLATVALMQGRAADVVPLAQRAMSLLEQGKNAPVDLADARFVLARGLWEVGGEGAGRRERAVALARQGSRDASDAW